jgi:RNA polymerase sigma factor (sigma-70 family)
VKSKHTDQELLAELYRFNPKILDLIYKEYFPLVKKMVCLNNGSIQDAEDVFQELMIVVHRKVVEKSLTLTSGLGTFLLAISKNLWRNHLTRVRNISIEDISLELIDTVNQIEDLETEQNQIRRNIFFQKHFLELPHDCQQILQLFFKKTPLDVIAKKLQYSSSQYAKKRKHICKKRLISKIFSDPEFKKITNEDNAMDIE